MGEKLKSSLLINRISKFIFISAFICLQSNFIFQHWKKLLWYISFSSTCLCYYRQHPNNDVIRFVRYHLLVSNSTFMTHSQYLEHVYMGPELNSNRFEISNRFQKSFCLHGNFIASNLEISNCFQKMFRLHGNLTAATLQTIARHAQMIYFN